MKSAAIQFTPWDKTHYAELSDSEIKVGNRVVVENDYGEDIGRVIEISDTDISKLDQQEKIKIVRIADESDLKQIQKNNENKEDQIETCRNVVNKYGLEMKIIDAHVSYDDKRIAFAFIADGRVDFRNAVKELTRSFGKSIRLHQLGVRDEAKFSGDVGSCGRGLCCREHLQKLGSVTSEFAEQQQIAHRGSERLSGICGRLKCCLAYEKDLYDELAAKLPAIGTRVRTKHGRGEVVGWHTLRGSVDVKIDPEKGKEDERPLIVEVPIKK